MISPVISPVISSVVKYGMFSLGGLDFLMSGSLLGTADNPFPALLSATVGLITVIMGCLITSYLKHIAEHPQVIKNIVSNEVCAANMNTINMQIQGITNLSDERHRSINEKLDMILTHLNIN